MKKLASCNSRKLENDFDIDRSGFRQQLVISVQNLSSIGVGVLIPWQALAEEWHHGMSWPLQGPMTSEIGHTNETQSEHETAHHPRPVPVGGPARIISFYLLAF